MAVRVVRMQRRIAAPIERVFAYIADHEGYARLPGVRRARLIRGGHEEPGGVGAQRELSIGPGRMTEQITAFDPPRYLAYRIVSAPFPIKHIGAEVRLREIAGGTEVHWVTRFRAKTPVGQRLVERSVAMTFTAAFGTALFFWKQLLEGEDPNWRRALPGGPQTNAPGAERPPAVHQQRHHSRFTGVRPRTLLPATGALVSSVLRSAASWPVRVLLRRRRSAGDR